MELLLIRHARPVRAEVLHGPADPELSDIGHVQAEALAKWLADEQLDAIYVSPLRRARQTAGPVEAITGIAAVVDNDVAEYDRDASEYIPIEELKATGDERWREVPETPEEFQHAVIAAMERIVNAHPGQRVAVICHGGVINVYAAFVLRLATSMFFLPGYTSINRFFAASTGERSMHSLNEMAHLRGLS
jgi:probable phosphoglycerate mutase